MALDEKLMELDIKSLIEIIEKPENEGTQYQIRAKDELEDRNISPEELNALAKEVNNAMAYEMIMNEDVTKEEVSIHKSSFLDEVEIRQIYIEQLDKYIKKKDLFRFDVWSYAIGGF